MAKIEKISGKKDVSYRQSINTLTILQGLYFHRNIVHSGKNYLIDFQSNKFTRMDQKFHFFHIYLQINYLRKIPDC